MNPSARPSLLGKLIGSVIMAAMLVLGLMFSMVLLVVVLTLGTLAFGYYWWKTRALRRAMQASVPQANSDGQVFEGEAVVIDEWQVRQHRALPVNPGDSSSGTTASSGHDESNEGTETPAPAR